VLLAGFGGYLAAERGLAAGTVQDYVSHARRFLAGLPAGTGVVGVCAKDVTEAVLRESAAVSVSATQFFVAGLRSFLRFCFIERQMPVDLSQAALPVTGRRRSSLPRGISKAEARALLDGCDRRSALGRRDWAMLVTLLRLGLLFAPRRRPPRHRTTTGAPTRPGSPDRTGPPSTAHALTGRTTRNP
jgi:integrase/recombinase XerD